MSAASAAITTAAGSQVSAARLRRTAALSDQSTRADGTALGACESIHCRICVHCAGGSCPMAFSISRIVLMARKLAAPPRAGKAAGGAKRPGVFSLSPVGPLGYFSASNAIRRHL